MERTKVISETVSESATSFTFYPCFLANFSNIGMSEMPIKTMRLKHGSNCIRFHNALYHDTTRSEFNIPRGRATGGPGGHGPPLFSEINFPVGEMYDAE